MDNAKLRVHLVPLLLILATGLSSCHLSLEPAPFAGQLSVAVIGDAEPKPQPVFENLTMAVDAINDLHEVMGLTCVVGVGDIAHQGSDAQYIEATKVLSELEIPFYTIIGNEEWADARKFQHYAYLWSKHDKDVGSRYVKNWAGYLFIFLSGERDGSDLSDHDIEWAAGILKIHGGQGAVLITHAPAPGVFAYGLNREIANERFQELYQYTNLKVVLSGHLHMDLDTEPGVVKDKNGVVHIHVPGIERTKVGDGHRPRFRVLSLLGNGLLKVETYDLTEGRFDPTHSWTLTLR